MLSSRAVGLGPALRKAALARSQAGARAVVLARGAATDSSKLQSLPPVAAIEILNKQRLNRPSSPHFTIYQPQITWLGSIANRVTGGALAGLLYAYSIAYLVSPDIFASAGVIEALGSLPESLKYAGKALLAAPFAFHSWNGLRHLSWDMGKFLSLKDAHRTGYAVLGATAVSTIALVMM